MPTDKEMTPNLLPCPFCGETPKLVDVCDSPSMKHVLCSATGECGDTGLLIALAKRDGSFDKAITAWNTRAAPPMDMPSMPDDVREAIDTLLATSLWTPERKALEILVNEVESKYER